MNGKQLWNKLLDDGIIPVNNEIILNPPLKIKTKTGNKVITRLLKNIDDVDVFTAGPKYSGRLAN